MVEKRYILLQNYCEHSKIEDEFIRNLFEYGLISVEKQDNQEVIHENEISEIEKLFRLHTDLGINYEGLDVISEMLKRVRNMEKEMEILRKRLRLYE